MNTQRIIFTSIVLLACNAYADEKVPPLGWSCQSCEIAEGWDIDLKAGFSYVTDDNYEFGDYTGFDDDGFFLTGDVLALYRDSEGDYVNLEGFIYSGDSMAFFLEAGQQGLFEARASYKAIPRRFFNDTL
ncbi:MAG: MtrB/PioB family outer membrane beta-barrel protein, partial [Gammaproteobacteria bacterium]